MERRYDREKELIRTVDFKFIFKQIAEKSDCESRRCFGSEGFRCSTRLTRAARLRPLPSDDPRQQPSTVRRLCVAS
jgi:hypothetical protein